MGPPRRRSSRPSSIRSRRANPRPPRPLRTFRKNRWQPSVSLRARPGGRGLTQNHGVRWRKADFLLCATAPLSPQLAAEAEARFGAPLYEIYGCTEAGQVATRRPVESPHWRPVPGVALFENEKGTWVKGGHIEKEVLLGDVIELCGRDAFLLHGRTADLINIAGKRTSLAHLNFQLNSIEGVRDGTFVMPEENDGTVARLTAFVVAPGLTS